MISNDYCSHCELGKVFYKIKEYEKALEYTDKAIDLSPGALGMYELKGKIMGALELIKTKYEMFFSLNHGLSKTGLPLIAVKIFDHDICLMLDTGSNTNMIDRKIYDLLEDKLTSVETSTDVLSLNEDSEAITVDIQFRIENYDYKEPFVLTKVTDVSEKYKEKTGTQIHGVLGVHFFMKHGWVLDFEENKVYKKI